MQFHILSIKTLIPIICLSWRGDFDKQNTYYINVKYLYRLRRRYMRIFAYLGAIFASVLVQKPILNVGISKQKFENRRRKGKFTE